MVVTSVGLTDPEIPTPVVGPEELLVSPLVPPVTSEVPLIDVVSASPVGSVDCPPADVSAGVDVGSLVIPDATPVVTLVTSDAVAAKFVVDPGSVACALSPKVSTSAESV